MLKKIISVRNVGRFVNSGLPGVPACAKYTQIFGANGFGKTTLCSILRSLAANDAGIIGGRARVAGGRAATPQIELLFDRGPVKFENGAWSTPVAEILVFDGHFIAENVHSGDAVDLDQKRNLYRVIVGKEGVGLAVEEERLAGESRSRGSDIKTAERTIQTHVPQGMKIEEFVQLPEDREIDKAIEAQSQQLGAVREAAVLKARAAMTELQLPAPPSGFSELLSKTLDGVADDAQRRITDWARTRNYGLLRAWITSPATTAPSAGNRSARLPSSRRTVRCSERNTEDSKAQSRKCGVRLKARSATGQSLPLKRRSRATAPQPNSGTGIARYRA
jgi:energy-coupling factor transporter ATP-binding protein EcfA2